MFSWRSERRISISCRSAALSFSDRPPFGMNLSATICPE